MAYPAVQSFLGGIAAGVAASWGVSRGLSRLSRNESRPPELYEFFVDNFWFETAGLENEKLNEPLRGSHKADIAILGGGFTGLSSAYNLSRRFPDKKIVLLEGACCGYGASGRNGGFCETTALVDDDKLDDPQARRDTLEVSFHGINQIREVISERGVNCDFEETGSLSVAFNEVHARYLEKECARIRDLGFDASLLQGAEFEAQIKSPRCIMGLMHPNTAILNPAKLARGMKRVVEDLGVEIRERTPVIRVTAGKMHCVETELGESHAPAIVLGLNAYSHKIGFFKNRLFPINAYVIATEPLSEGQWASIGWQNRQGLADVRPMFDYLRPTVDGRIVIGGSDYAVYASDGLSTGNDKSIIQRIQEDLFATFPQLEGLGIEHAWGGSIGHSRDFVPSVGVMGEYENIYYGVGYNEGVPNAQTAGRMIADLMAGETNLFTTHYTVNHKLPWAGPGCLRPIAWRFARWYVERFVPVTFYK
jgi:glycine/D-amino acid oxidase-like deaminating enzyme